MFRYFFGIDFLILFLCHFSIFGVIFGAQGVPMATFRAPFSASRGSKGGVPHLIPGVQERTFHSRGAWAKKPDAGAKKTEILTPFWHHFSYFSHAFFDDRLFMFLLIFRFVVSLSLFFLPLSASVFLTFFSLYSSVLPLSCFLFPHSSVRTSHVPF